ncbi:MAG: FAD-dependent oxidoreductase [Dehalococcoidia bacterium]|nr:FAD-dependent oxidoreductase [Dehalococcoidia bacterium]
MGRQVSTRYLLIGNSAGAIAAAEAIRELDTAGPITIISDERHPAYSRPLISDYLAGHRSIKQTFLGGPGFYSKNGIETVLGTKATRLDIEGRAVELDDGTALRWEKLLLATGGSPIRPDVAGISRSGVFTFTTLDDAVALRREIDAASRVVVIGGGLIGVSVSQALVSIGAKVIIVELMDRILSAALDSQASAMVEARLREAGVKVITGRSVEQIIGARENGRRAAGVVLDDGREIACQAVVSAVGVSPRTDLVSGTAIKTRRGIVVDSHMMTSCPDVYACGDVAEVYDFARGETRPNPIWPNAVMGGRIAGHNMARAPGLPARAYEGSTNLNAFNYFGMAIVSAGIVEPPKNGGYRVLRSQTSGGRYRRVVLKDGRVVGAIFAGDIQSAGVVYGLMRAAIDTHRFEKALAAEDFSFASLPPHARQRLLDRAGIEEDGRNAGR